MAKRTAPAPSAATVGVICGIDAQIAHGDTFHNDRHPDLRADLRADLSAKAAATADLFPDKLVESELGEIPEGWRMGRLDELVLLQRGFDLPATKRTNGRYSVLAASGPSGSHDEFMVRGPGVTTGRSGVLGRVFFVHQDFWPLNTSLWVKEFRAASPAYAFHLMPRLDFESFNAGSAVPTLNRNHIHNLRVLVPSRAAVDVFDTTAMSMMGRSLSNEEQSRTLAQLRDTLLPKLISGELRVTSLPASPKIGVSTHD